MILPSLKFERQPSRLPILIVLHQETSSPGRVGQLLRERGFPLDIRYPFRGDLLPGTLAHHSGAVIFGGPQSANDEHDYIKQEIDWLSVPLSENKPYLGICLGAQMLVRNLGGRVAAREGDVTEIGWYPITPTDHGQKLLDWPKMVYHFHREGFDLPTGATLLAEGEAYRHQAFQYGDRAFGVQFHAELTRAMMHRWVVHGAHRFDMPNAQVGKAHLDGRFLYDIALKQWLHQFLELVFEPRQN